MPEYIDAYGITIVYDVFEPEGEPRGVVQLLHGVGEHSGRYSALVAALTAHGYVVYADDHRGHGRTGMKQWEDAGRLGRLGPGGHRAAVAAVFQLTELIRAERQGLPLVLLGHSWGSFLAQILLNQHPESYDAVVLSGSALRVPGALNSGPLNAPWKGPDATGREWLATLPAVGEEFAADPLTVDVPLLRLFGPIEAARLFGRPRRNLGRDIPMLLQVGRDDTVGGPRSVHRLAQEYRQRSGLTDVTTLVYPDTRHEIFNDASQEQVRGDLLAWLDDRVRA